MPGSIFYLPLFFIELAFSLQRRVHLKRPSGKLDVQSLALQVHILNVRGGERDQVFLTSLYDQQWRLAADELHVLDPANLASGIKHRATGQVAHVNRAV